MSEKATILAYTDGALVGSTNSKVAGIAFTLECGTRYKERCASFAVPGVTSQMAELLAVYLCVDSLISEDSHLIIHTDSAYAITCYENGKTWRDRGWQTGSVGKAANKPIVEKIIDLIDERYDLGNEITFTKVKGHSGIPGNEKVDILATGAAKLTIPCTLEMRLIKECIELIRESVEWNLCRL